MVLTLNLTGAGLGGNREYAAVDDDPTDVAAAEAIFAADAHRRRDRRRRPDRLVTSPESSRPTLLALIGGARASLALETRGADRPGRSSARCSTPAARGVA